MLPSERPTPAWAKKILNASLVNLGDLQQYIEQYEKANDFAEKYNEIFEQLYDLIGLQLLMKKDFTTVWGVPNEYQKYIGTWGYYDRLFGTSNMLRYKLDIGIKSQNLNPDNLPDIPLTEYMLVPTGNVETYHAYKDKAEQQRQRGAHYWREWDWKKRVFDKQDERYKKRLEDSKNEKK